MKQALINHVALVVDKSSSMRKNAEALIKMVDALIRQLALRSEELKQETRISVYTFSDTVECVFYDQDVLRLPSITRDYEPYGMTALRDATFLSQEELEATAQLHGDHAFLTYVLTDGMENKSKNVSTPQLSRKLTSLPENWTVAVLVPDVDGVEHAKRFGFPEGNIRTWDTVGSDGIVDVGEVITSVTDDFMVARSTGVRGSRTLFSTGADALNSATVRAAGLNALSSREFALRDVPSNGGRIEIRPFAESAGIPYHLGIAYYQLTKRENIQRGKKIAVRSIKTGDVYTGDYARQLIGLPDMDTRVTPDFNPEYQVFVQSRSVNRRLVPGTKLLVIY